ncbi:MAG: methyltransferase domain-containing protein, partial [Ignavibacteriae bacterium]|nr:methyltransferase domain-containing protein [Ignavibacteriota bacterium]
YDETALVKINSGKWLHEEIVKVAKYVYVIDNSKSLLEKNVSISTNSKIVFGNVTDLIIKDDFNPDIIVAGELIEHLPDVLNFFKNVKKLFNGKKLICTTPNATSYTNSMLSFLKRESCHKDHLQVYTYKTINTLCLLSGFEEWEIIPYHIYFTEMILEAKGINKMIIKFAEKIVNFVEIIFPLASGGLILNVKKI